MSGAGLLVGVSFGKADPLLDGIRVNAQCIVMRGLIFRDPIRWSFWSCPTLLSLHPNLKGSSIAIGRRPQIVNSGNYCTQSLHFARGLGLLHTLAAGTEWSIGTHVET